jgi:hypothetical protein
MSRSVRPDREPVVSLTTVFRAPEISNMSDAASVLASIDATTQAAVQTATYTFQLAIGTFALAGLTFISIIVSITLQVMNNRREDNLRRTDAQNAEAARREQYAHTVALRQQDRDESLIVRRRRDEALNAQLIEILKSYETYMRLLQAIPHHDMSAQAATADTLFSRAFSTDIGESLPSEKREPTYRALVKAQETLNASIAQQQSYNHLVEQLNAEQDAAAQYKSDLESAEVLARAQPSQLNLDRVNTLKTSPRSVEARRFAQSKAERSQQLPLFHAAITQNAAAAAEALANSRALLGDTYGPLPPMQEGHHQT